MALRNGGDTLKNEKFGFDRRAIIASPVVAGNKVIVGGRDGFLYAVDKDTGKQFGGLIMKFRGSYPR